MLQVVQLKQSKKKKKLSCIYNFLVEFFWYLIKSVNIGACKNFLFCSSSSYTAYYSTAITTEYTLFRIDTYNMWNWHFDLNIRSFH